MIVCVNLRMQFAIFLCSFYIFLGANKHWAISKRNVMLLSQQVNIQPFATAVHYHGHPFQSLTRSTFNCKKMNPYKYLILMMA